MPVTKFRSLGDAARSLGREPGDPSLWDGVVRRWKLHRFFAREDVIGQRTPGVYKYASVEEKQRRQARDGEGQPMITSRGFNHINLNVSDISVEQVERARH